MADESIQAAERLLASLPHDVLGRLADLIALKLMEKDGRFVPSKQVVAGSSPVSRSKPVLTTCLPPNSLAVQLARYRLDACARGYSEKTINHTEKCVHAFGAFKGGIDDVAAVGSDDLRRFIVRLKDKPAS